MIYFYGRLQKSTIFKVDYKKSTIFKVLFVEMYVNQLNVIFVVSCLYST